MIKPFIAMCLLAVSACNTEPTFDSSTPVRLSEFSDDDTVWSPQANGQYHKYSGFTCPEEVGQWRFKDANVTSGSVKGMNVGCHMSDEYGGVISFFIVHSSQAPALPEHFAKASGAMRIIAPAGDKVPVPTQSNGSAITTLAEATRLTPYDGRIRNDTEIQDTVLWMDEVDFWHVYARATYYRGFETETADGAAALFKRARNEIPLGIMSPK